MTQPLQFYLSVFRPNVYTRARVTSVSSQYPNNTIGLGSVVGSNPLYGMTALFGTSLDGQERGMVRVRSYSAGTLVIAEDSIVNPNIAVNDYVTIKDEFRLWPIFPTYAATGTSQFHREDFDIVYNGDNTSFPPMAIAGPPMVGFLDGGSFQARFVGDRSYSLEGNSLTYAWSAPDSVELTSSAQGTLGSPVVFTFTTTGPHRVSLTVTDGGNSKTHTAHTYVLAFSRTENTSEQSSIYTNFEQTSISADYERGGAEVSFSVHGVSDASAFPPDTMVVLWYEGTLTTRTATWPHRDNILFVGYITKDGCFSVPEHDYVQFSAATVDNLLRNLSVYPATLTDSAAPADWIDMKNPTIDKLMAFLARQRSTVSLMAPMVRMNSTRFLWKQDFGPGNLWSQMDGLAQDHLGHICASMQGVLYVERTYHLMVDSERAAVATRKELTSNDWVNRIEVDEIAKWSQPASSYQIDGYYYPGGNVGASGSFPYISLAPGRTQAPTGHPQTKSQLILISQDDLNARSGLLFARANNPYPKITAEFINDGSFDNAPQEKFLITTSHPRTVFTQKKSIPRNVRVDIDGVNGIIKTTVSFEPETTGATGTTILITAPSSPTATGTHTITPPWVPPAPWSPPSTGLTNAYDIGDGLLDTIAAGTTQEMLYFTTVRAWTIVGITAYCTVNLVSLNVWAGRTYAELVVYRNSLGKWTVERYDGNSGTLLTTWTALVASASLSHGLSGLDVISVISNGIFRTNIVTTTSGITGFAYGLQGVML